MNAKQDQKANARAHTESAPKAIVYQREVSCDSSRADSIAKQEHEIARPAMYLCPIVHFVAFCPSFVAIVILLHQIHDDPGYPDKQRHDQREKSEISMWTMLLLPVDVGIDL